VKELWIPRIDVSDEVHTLRVVSRQFKHDCKPMTSNHLAQLSEAVNRLCTVLRVGTEARLLRLTLQDLELGSEGTESRERNRLAVPICGYCVSRDTMDAVGY
jgi:hypothetical protein